MFEFRKRGLIYILCVRDFCQRITIFDTWNCLLQTRKLPRVYADLTGDLFRIQHYYFHIERGFFRVGLLGPGLEHFKTYQLQ